jgi:hypothetical protein
VRLQQHLPSGFASTRRHSPSTFARTRQTRRHLPDSLTFARLADIRQRPFLSLSLSLFLWLKICALLDIYIGDYQVATPGPFAIRMKRVVSGPVLLALAESCSQLQG